MARKVWLMCWSAELLLVSFMLHAAGAGETLTPESVVVTQAMAEKGDPEAQYEMGLKCYEGKGVSKDMAESCKWLTLSAGQGEKRALRLLEEVKLFATAEEIAEGQRRADAERPPTNRLTVALLGWENKTGDAAAAHWAEAENYLIGGQLGEVRSLRLLPSVGYGLGQLNTNVGDPLELAETRRLGELIEARRVVWGSYQREGENWVATVRVLNVATGMASSDLRAASTNWYEIRDQLSGKILKELGVIPTPTERRRMARRHTASSGALEWLMKTGLVYDNAPELEKYARQAVAADPQCAAAHVDLAVALAHQGKMEEAEKEAREALKIEPDGSFAYKILGVCFAHEQKFEDAEKGLRIATKLDPDDPEPLERLGEIYCLQDRLDAAIVQYEKALQLDPFDASTHAQLGRTYALQGQQGKALAELKAAEQLAYSDDFNTQQVLAMAYFVLREVPLALEHSERFVALARKRGLNPKVIKSFEARSQEMRARLVPVYVSATPPRDYAGAGLAELLRQRLTREEFGLVTDPLACTPAMNQWAQELTKGATNDLQKAKMLFDALTRRLNTGSGGFRTAQEVFVAWNDPNASFLCMEYTFLYVVLARAIGLRAYFTNVHQDAAGENAIHACAAVCLADKVLLADPAYFWFGVPHRKFVLLDDLQTVSCFLSQLHDLRLNRIAAKLCPDLALAQFMLAEEFMNEGRWEDARQVLTTALKLEPDGYLANLCRGRLAMHEDKFGEAFVLLEKAIKLNSTEGSPHLLLADIYTRKGKLREARQELRQALRCALSDKNAELARRRIAELNEQLGSD